MVDACGRRVGPDLPSMRAAVCALTGIVGAALCAPVDGGHPLACRLAPDRRSAQCGQPRAAACGGARPARCDRVADRRGARCRCSKDVTDHKSCSAPSPPGARRLRVALGASSPFGARRQCTGSDGSRTSMDAASRSIVAWSTSSATSWSGTGGSLQKLSEAHEQRQADGSALRRPDPCHRAGSRTRSCSFPSWWRGRSARRASRRPGG